MSSDHTLPQSGEELRRAQQQSVQRVRPPTQVPGYEAVRFLGAGAYGEVWVAVDVNTRRRVAIKFYTHRGGLDWSLLSREVEKLAFLFADRYVVQLIDVGWDADPPYYVMEYLENGSLADRLRAGPMSIQEAATIFREITIGLIHSHGKGVLHCDLKPGNVLLDQDHRPRLADFGQSRLSHEQRPALGTLFYMAPEQADLKAAPDARWDVYGLGAVLYCMLTGQPPYRTASAATVFSQTSDLEQQLERYQRFLHESPKPDLHRQVPGMDRELAEIVDRCLALNPHKRFANPQAVLDALSSRAVRRARRPLLVLGAVGPAVLLLVMSMFAWSTSATTVRQSEKALTQRAGESNRFAAQFVSESVAGHINRRWSVLEQEASAPGLAEMLNAAKGQPVNSPERQALQKRLADIVENHPEISAASWLVYDARGRQMARVPFETGTIDGDYSFRDYYHGRGKDFDRANRPADLGPVDHPYRSLVFVSDATGDRKVSFTVPIYDPRDSAMDKKPIGAIVSTVNVGGFTELRSRDKNNNDQLAVLIDLRPDSTGRVGSVLEHPHLNSIEGAAKVGLYLDQEQLQEFEALHKSRVEAPSAEAATEDEFDNVNTQYHDPVGGHYDGHWVAAAEPVVVRGRPTDVGDVGWLVVVQERYDEVVSPARELGHKLVRAGLIALAVVAAVVTALWGFVMLVLNETPRTRWWRRLRRKTGLSAAELSGIGSAASGAGMSASPGSTADASPPSTGSTA